MAEPLVPREPAANQDQLAQAFDAGRRAGLATAALALSIVAFFSLLGAEKAILAIVLGLYARRGARPGSSARRLATAAIGVAGVFLVSVALVLVLFWHDFVGLINHLRQLS